MRNTMKYLITLFLLIPSALTAMDQASSAPKPKPREIFIAPVLCHARADQGHRTIRGWNSAYTSFCDMPGSCHIQMLDKKLKFLETIPNHETKLFTVLYSLKNNENDSEHLALAVTSYGQTVPLGDAANGVQYFLRIPNFNDIFYAYPPSKTPIAENYTPSETAQALQAVIALCNKPAQDSSDQGDEIIRE